MKRFLGVGWRGISITLIVFLLMSAKATAQLDFYFPGTEMPTVTVTPTPKSSDSSAAVPTPPAGAATAPTPSAISCSASGANTATCIPTGTAADASAGAAATTPTSPLISTGEWTSANSLPYSSNPAPYTTNAPPEVTSLSGPYTNTPAPYTTNAAPPAAAPSSGVSALPPSVSNLKFLSPNCQKIFGLDNGTAFLDSQYLTPQLCKADEDLLLKYPSNACNASIYGNFTKPPGIMKLNTTFAVNIDSFLNMPELQSVKIVYGYVDPANQPKTTGACAQYGAVYASHMRGCAVTLDIPKDKCDSAVCKFIQANAKAFGLYTPVPGGYNFLQPDNDAACNSVNGTAPMSPTGTAPGNSANGNSGNNASNAAAPKNPSSNNPSYQASPQTKTAAIGSGEGGLFSGQMGSMLGLMMGMQVGQIFSAALNRPATASYTNTAPAVPAPLPPIPVTPISTTPTGSSNLDTLIASLNGTPSTTSCATDAQVCPDGTTVGRTGPSCSFAACPASTSTVGQLMSTSTPPTTTSSSTTMTTSGPGSISVSSSTDGNGSQMLNGTISANGTESTSTSQTVLSGLYNILSSIGSFLGGLFGLNATSTTP